MSEEDKEAIEYLEDSFKNTVTHKEKFNIIKNLIKSQQEEIEKNKKLINNKNERLLEYAKDIAKKDKIIDEISDFMISLNIDNTICKKSNCTSNLINNTLVRDCKNCIKQYFEKKVGESNEN